MNRSRFVALAALTLAAAASRLVPHPPNFAPIGALALFGGAAFAGKRAAFLVPLVAMLLSDLAIGLASGDMALGLHRLIPVVYGAFVLIVCLGFLLRRRRPVPIALATLAGSALFFLVTNFGVWALGTTYPRSWEGLVACYVAGLPWFGNTMLGDATYATLLFGGLALLERGVPSLRAIAQAPSV
jgi:hypothetical protein